MFFGAAATTGPWAARARHRLPSPPSPFRPGRPQRRPTAEGPSASGGERHASEGGADDEGGGALNLRYAGSAVDSLWWGNYMEEPLALAIRRWSPGTVERWTAILRDVGRSRRTGLSWTQRGHYPSTSSGAPPWASSLGHCEASYPPSAWQRSWAAYHPQCGPYTGSWHEAPRPPLPRHGQPKCGPSWSPSGSWPGTSGPPSTGSAWALPSSPLPLSSGWVKLPAYDRWTFGRDAR